MLPSVAETEVPLLVCVVPEALTAFSLVQLRVSAMVTSEMLPFAGTPDCATVDVEGAVWSTSKTEAACPAKRVRSRRMLDKL